MPAGHTVIGGDELTNLDVIRGSAPEQRFEETDQTDPAGRFRLRVNGDILSIQLAASAGWATVTTLIELGGTPAGVAGEGVLIRGGAQGNTIVLGWGSTFRVAEAQVTTDSDSGVATAIAGSVLLSLERTVAAEAAIMTALYVTANLEGTNTQNYTDTPISIAAIRATVETIDAGVPSGTITGAAAVYVTSSLTAGATVTNFYGLYIANPGSGTITNNYGIYLADQTRGATLDVGLYIAGADTAAIYIAADPLRLADSVVLGLGTGTGLGSPDATLTYNGTNVVLNPAVIGAGVVAFGGGEAGVTAPTGTTLRGPNVTTGGAGNIAGADLTIAAGLGTGTGDVGQLIFQTPRVAVAGDNIQTLTTLAVMDADALVMQDDQRLAIGTTEDTALVNSSAGVAANTALTGVLVGTPVTPIAPAANSLLIGNITASGDILIAVNKAGTSHMAFMADASTGDTLVQASTGQSVDVYIAGVKQIDYATGAMAFQQTTTISTTTGTLNLIPTVGIGLMFANNARGAVTAGGFGDYSFTGTLTGANYTTGFSSRFAGVTAPASNTGDISDYIIWGSTLTVTDGTHALGATLFIPAGSTKAGAGTITNGATVYIGSAFTGASTANYSLWIDAGLSRFDAQVIVGFTDAGVNVTGNSIMPSGGIAFTDVANAWIDDATHGTGTVTHYIGNNTIDVTASSIQWKENISLVNGAAKQHLDVFSSLLREYDYKNGTGHFVGMIAEDVRDVLPQYVVGTDTPSLRYNYMVGPLLWGWQNHESRIARLERQLVAAGITPEE